MFPVFDTSYTAEEERHIFLHVEKCMRFPVHLYDYYLYIIHIICNQRVFWIGVARTPMMEKDLSVHL